MTSHKQQVRLHGNTPLAHIVEYGYVEFCFALYEHSFLYGRPMEQDRPLYFCPVVSFFLLLLLSFFLA